MKILDLNRSLFDKMLRDFDAKHDPILLCGLGNMEVWVVGREIKEGLFI